jgi:hypothetical protein
MGYGLRVAGCELCPSGDGLKGCGLAANVETSAYSLQLKAYSLQPKA